MNLYMNGTSTLISTYFTHAGVANVRSQLVFSFRHFSTSTILIRRVYAVMSIILD